MNVFVIVGGTLLILASLAIIISVALQEPKGGLGGTFGGNESSFFDKNKGRSAEAQLSRLTKFGGIALFILTLAVLAVNVYLV